MISMPFLIVFWMVLAATGGGLAVLRSTGLLETLGQFERLTIAFVIGIGLIGWLAFFPGIAGLYNGTSFAVLLAVMTAGLAFVRMPARPGTPAAPLTRLEWLVLAGLAAMLVMDLCEGLSPAADADTMAYHFETPRRFLAEGGIFAIPRALDGVSQLLLQMTYGVALGLGGKSAVPLWTMVSGWGLGALFYVLARRHVSRFWSMSGTLCLMTTPAVIYSAGAGHVEVRAASFALLAAYAAAQSVTQASSPKCRTGWVILAGLVAGFFAGTKVTGLIFAFAVCVPMFGSPGAVRRMIQFSLAAALSGSQWYLFNWSATGDPLYPLLWKFVDLAPGFSWNAELDELMQLQWSWEHPLPRSLLWYILYPVRSVYFPPTQLESLRTGLGPTCILMLPFAALAFARAERAAASPLFRILIAAIIFYTIWYVFGPSQRIRHLLVVYPIVLLCLFVGASRFVDEFNVSRRILITGLAAVVSLQLGGQAIFSKKFIDYLTTDMTRDSFLESNIGGYAVIEWLNGHLNQDDLVLVINRDWLYWLDVPYLYSNTFHQIRQPVYPTASGLSTYVRTVREAGITHLALPQLTLKVGETARPDDFVATLDRLGCIRQVATIEGRTISSRTLPLLQSQNLAFLVFEINPDKCPD